MRPTRVANGAVRSGPGTGERLPDTVMTLPYPKAPGGVKHYSVRIRIPAGGLPVSQEGTCEGAFRSNF